MKKWMLLVLAINLCVPSIAFADVLSVDFSTASLDELLQAQQQIADRIAELQTTDSASIERLELSGTGSSILSDIVIPFSPCRIILESSTMATVTLTVDSYDFKFIADRYDAEFYSKQGTGTLRVETDGDWTFTAEPIIEGAAFPMSGSGPYVSDFFELSAPMTVTVKGAPGAMMVYPSNLTVMLREQYESVDLWGGITLASKRLTPAGDAFSADVTLLPVTGRTQYCLAVICGPGIEWSITPKQ